MADNNPILLSHNVLERAFSLSGNEFVSRELERMRDGHRHTWWQAPSTAPQSIIIFAENLVTNGNFEINLAGWNDLAIGAGAGTFTRNTTTPIVGDADMEVDATTADGSTDIYSVYQHKPIFFKGGRTYRIMIRGKAQGGVPKQARFGFQREGLIQDPDYYDDVPIQPGGSTHYHDVTPDTDVWVRPYVYALEVSAINYDEIFVGEVRDIDTLIIDKGHNLALAYITIEYSNDSIPTWATAMTRTLWENNAPIYFTFTGTKALAWRVIIEVDSGYAGVEHAKVPQLYLGKRWEIDKNRVNFYDPHEKRRIEHSIIGERGVQQRTERYNQRAYRTTLQPFKPSEYSDIEKFFEDTENGYRPFFFIPRPDSDMNDILFMQLKQGRNVPYFAPNQQRSWNFDIEEVVGARRV